MRGLTCGFVRALIAVALSYSAPAISNVFAADVSFRGLGIPAGYIGSKAMAVSENGTVVGSLIIDSSTAEGMCWTAADGIVSLGNATRGTLKSGACDISSDGSVIIGNQDVATNVNHGYRWTSATGVEAIPGTPLSIDYVFVGGISGDGKKIVGSTIQKPYYFYDAFQWTASTGTTLLSGAWYAEGISRNGATIYGRTIPPTAVVWTNPATSGIQVGTSADAQFSQIRASTSDGSVLVGSESLQGGGTRLFRWTVQNGIQPLNFNFTINAMSGDGSVIVGDNGKIWDVSHGVRYLQTVLTNDYNLDLSGWNLESLMDISLDGSTIVGYGTHNFRTEGFVVTVPEPGAITLIFLFGISMIRRMRS